MSVNKELSQAIPDIDFATLDLLPYGIIVTDQRGLILYYNSREEQIANRRRIDVIGKNFFSEVAPCTQVQDFYGRFNDVMQQKDVTVSFHFNFPFPNNHREVDITLTSFEHAGMPVCMIAINDVTEESLVRERILRAERLQQAGEVAASVAHNFNNVLTAIRGFTQLLIVRASDGPKVQEYAQTILKASDDGVEMVRRIKETTRLQPENVDESNVVDLNEVIKDSITMTESYAQEEQHRRGVEITLDLNLPSTARLVRGRASELREVFINLIRNAIDAIENRGSISLRYLVDDKWHTIEVADTGVGMDQATQGKLFRPLFTTKGDLGTGLGLSSSYAIVQRHGGEIDVKSIVGGGTTFTIRFPKG